MTLKILNFIDYVKKIEENFKNDNEIYLLNERKELFNRILEYYKVDTSMINQFQKQYTIQNIDKYAKMPKTRSNEAEYIFESMINENEAVEVKDVEEKMAYLNGIEQPEQRTQEWFDYRHGVVTASSASHIFGTESEMMSYIKEKVLPQKTFKAGTACLHGIKFEDVAQKIYERLTNTKVGEYGCIRHKTIDYLGASPDGIVIESKDPKLAGRMLEIKCLYSRELTGVPLYKYWVQCQLQMECCDLDYCDFFECKIDETLNKNDFYKMIKENTANFYSILIEFEKDDKIQYKYANMCESDAYYKIWLENMIDELVKNDTVKSIKQTFWKLDKCCKTTIKRQDKWFKSVESNIKNFWEKVKNYRQILKDNPEKESELFPVKKRKQNDSKVVCMIIDDEKEDEFAIHNNF